MKYKIYGENVSIDNALSFKIEQRLSSLGKYFVIKDEDEAIIVVKDYGNSLKVELSIVLKDLLIRNEIVHDDLYSAIDLLIMRLEDKVRAQKKALMDGHRDLLAESFCDRQFDGNDFLVRVKELELEILSRNEAILRMEMSSHSFYVYKDISSKKTAVVYKRNDGNYGLLEIF